MARLIVWPALFRETGRSMLQHTEPVANASAKACLRCLRVRLSVSVCLSACLPALCVCVCVSVCLCVCVSVCQLCLPALSASSVCLSVCRAAARWTLSTLGFAYRGKR